MATSVSCSKELDEFSGFENLYTGMKTDMIYNWSKTNPIALKTQIRLVETEDGIRNLMLTTPKESMIRPVGSCLSYESISALPLDDPNSVIVDLTRMRGLVYLDDRKLEATFWGGTQVDEVIKTLATHNLQMTAAPGVIGIQTLAGAIATGTHGQGINQCSYGGTVVRTRLILNNGDIVVVGKEEDEHLRNAIKNSPMAGANALFRPDLPLEAFTLSLGLLGIVTQITIKVEKRKIYMCRKFDTSFEDLTENYILWNKQNEYVKAWWFADDQTCQVWLTNTASDEEVRLFLEYDSHDIKPLELGSVNKNMNTTVVHYLHKMEKDTLTQFNREFDSLNDLDSPKKFTYFDTVTRFANSRDTVGYIEQLLCKGIPAPQINCEIAIPCSEFPKALTKLSHWMKTSGNLHYPIILRATGKSNSWLTQSQQDSVHIGSLVYLSENGTVRADAMKVMGEFQEILSNFKGLPHLGKHFSPQVFVNNFRNKDIYPHATKFFELRKKLDPHNRFLSHFLRKNWADFI